MEDTGFREFLEKAFVAARDSGKRDWHLMTVAVLKNRLLQMTNRTFDEKEFGADSFMQLVARHSDLVAIDRSTRPPTVVWSAAVDDEDTATKEATASTRIRADLWRAVLDYSFTHNHLILMVDP